MSENTENAQYISLAQGEVFQIENLIFPPFCFISFSLTWQRCDDATGTIYCKYLMFSCYIRGNTS